MTIENCLKLLKNFKANLDNPKFNTNLKKRAQFNYDNMKNHILNSKKFENHPILLELNPTKPKEVKPEVKSGKKPKR